MALNPIERFETKFTVDPETGCHNWNAGMSDDGYGSFWANGRTIPSHRFAYQTYVAPISPEVHVLHRCDNRRCVNPRHLFPGTNTVNMDDKVAKGRQAKGESHGMVKLTREDVLSIRSDDRLQRVIAAQYGLNQTQVSKIKLRKAWASL